MKTIASFTVNHDTLKEGMYISRIDGDVVTYDIRMKLPNGGDYLPTAKPLKSCTTKIQKHQKGGAEFFQLPFCYNAHIIVDQC